jgi:hypothetical protein
MDVLNLKFHSQQINSISSLLKKYEPQGYQCSITIIAPEVENVLNEYRDFLIVFRKNDMNSITIFVRIFGEMKDISNLTSN